MTDDATTDDAALDRLERFGGGKLLREMIALFVAGAPERIAAAGAGAAAGDAESTERALHSLKSSSAQLGAVRMQKMSERGEMLARAGTLNDVGVLVRELEEEFGRVKVWLTARERGSA